MNKTIRNILYFSLSVVFVKIIGIFNTFYLAKLLTPAEYGIWITLLLITSYSTITCLGTVDALVKLYPFYKGQKRLDSAINVEKGVFGSIFLSAGLLLIIGLPITFLMKKSVLNESIGLIRIMVFSSSILMFSSFYRFRILAHQNFKKVGLIDGMRSLSNFCFIVTFSRWWGLYGTVIGFTMNEFILAIVSYFYCKSYRKLTPSFKWKVLFNLIKTGLPITMIWWIYMVQSSISRILSMQFLGKISTGYLGLGIGIVSVLILIPQTVGRVLYPKINEELGKSDTNNIDKFVVLPAKLISLIVALALGIMVILTPWLITSYFVKYKPAVSCTLLLLLGGYFLSMNQNGINYLVAANKQKIMLYYVIATLLLNSTICLLLIKLNFGIIGIALGTDISSIVFTSLIWYTVFKNLGYQLWKCFKNLLSLYLPFIVSSLYLCVFLFLFQVKLVCDIKKLILCVNLFILFYISTIWFLPFINIHYFKEVTNLSKRFRNVLFKKFTG